MRAIDYYRHIGQSGTRFFGTSATSRTMGRQGNRMDLHEFFAMEVKPAMGCTEPVAVALATAVGARELGSPVEGIDLELSLNIYKNGLDVGIPGTNGLRGNRVAAALGALAGNPDKGLLVLEGVSEDAAREAKAMVDAGRVRVQVRDEGPGVYVAATLHGGGEAVCVVIQDRHDLVRSIVRNGETVYSLPVSDAPGSAGHPMYLEELKDLSMQDMWDLAGSLDAELEEAMMRGREMNMAVARQGLVGSWGLGVGATLREHSGDTDILTRVKTLAGAAADVRMSGMSVPVMSSAGSGNHGITAIVPVAVVGEAAGASRRAMAESLALSHLVTGYVKIFTGRLTPICGCSVAAGAGAAAGIVRVLGGSADMAEHAVASLISSLMGMLCDGAKGSCGLKVSAAAGEAYAAALMAMDRRGVQRDEGLVSPNLQTTARALSSLCTRAFADMDRVIVELLRMRPDC